MEAAIWQVGNKGAYTSMSLTFVQEDFLGVITLAVGKIARP